MMDTHIHKSLSDSPYRALAWLAESIKLMLIFGLLWSAPATSWAAEAIGRLAEAEGRVELNGAPAQAGAELRLGMRVTTEVESRAVLQFADGQIVSLKPGSVYWIKDYQYAGPGAAENRSATELLKGGLRFISGTIAKEKPAAVQVNTPTATIGVRGTEFTVVLGSTCLLVYQGAVIVSAAGQSVVAHPGQIVFVMDANTPPVLMTAPERAACDAPDRKQQGLAPTPTMTVGCACLVLLQTAPASPVLPTSPPGAAGAGAAGAGAGAAAPTTILGLSPVVAAGTAAAVAASAALIVREVRKDDTKASPASPP